MLIERFAEAEPFVPNCTSLGGVVPLKPSLAKAGELFRIILIPGARLGVSEAARVVFAGRLRRIGSITCSCRPGDEGTGALSNSAWVTFENLIAGGGSSSESLSSISMRFSIGASAEKP